MKIAVSYLNSKQIAFTFIDNTTLIRILNSIPTKVVEDNKVSK